MAQKTSTPPPLSKDLQEALEDVRQIREVMDKVRLSHPVRQVFRPLMLLGFWGAPLFFSYGWAAQWIYSRSSVLGISRTAALWALSIAVLVSFGIAKQILFYRSTRSGGYHPLRFLRRILLIDGYGRVIFAMAGLTSFSIAFAVSIGRPEDAVGFLMMGAGAIFLIAPLAIPIPEISIAGFFGLLAGGISLFVLPGYPFAKFAILMGGWNLIVGWVGLRLPKAGSDG